MLEILTKVARLAQHSTAQQLAKLHPKFFFLSFLATSSLLLPTVSFANTANSIQNQISQISQVPQLSAKDSYGCKAFLCFALCFAGGLHEPACQKTILQVKQGLIGGRGSSRVWTQNIKKRVYVQDADGTTRQVARLRKR